MIEYLGYQLAGGGGENKIINTATVLLKVEGKLIKETDIGEGPLEAIFKAVDRAIGIKVNLLNYSLKAEGEGKKALGKVELLISISNQKAKGEAISRDVLEASLLAYINAINKILEDSPKEGKIIWGTCSAYFIDNKGRRYLLVYNKNKNGWMICPMAG